MSFKRGDICYIIENSPKAIQGKVVSKQGHIYIIQLIGSCGALRLTEDRLFQTAIEAEESLKTPSAKVHVQLSKPQKSLDFFNIST